MILNYLDYCSCWIFFWFILYFVGIIEYNPTFALLMCSVIVISLTFLLSVHHKLDQHKQIGILKSTFIYKVIPLTLLWIRNDLIVRDKDVFFTIGMFILYHFYLFLRGTSFTAVYTEMYRDIKCK